MPCFPLTPSVSCLIPSRSATQQTNDSEQCVFKLSMIRCHRARLRRAFNQALKMGQAIFFTARWTPRWFNDLSGGDIEIEPSWGDRKSTRLNSSHQIISYAVFCLKKKKQKKPLN